MIVYSKDNCGWCTKTIEALAARGIEATVFKLNVDYSREDLHDMMVKKLGRTDFALTLPQVLDYKGKIIGGYAETIEYLESISTGENYD